VEQRFRDRTVLVTGAAGGIGRAVSLAFAREGARLVLCDLSESTGAAAVAAAQDAGGHATFLAADVSQPEQVERVVRQLLDKLGRLDCAVNNAGIPGTRARTADRTVEEWSRVLAVNLTGTWLCMKHELPPMLAQGSGAIVNVASVAGLLGVRRFSAYSASKHGVVGLTKSAALEYGRFGVRVNAVCPGLVDTDLLRHISTDGLAADASFPASVVGSLRHRVAKRVLAAKQPSRRLSKPEEIAEAVLWLCSDAASFVNGHALVVDGGFSVK
jgi:NAD(P)-dependent dehydrogenase (short-subunit alcohol dehydrogenase family)